MAGLLRIVVLTNRSHFDLMAHGGMLSACSSSGLVSVACERNGMLMNIILRPTIYLHGQLTFQC
jgi:hypothetical protein